MTDDAIKAGRRHSASDAAIMKAMHADVKAYAAKMSDYLKALGFEDTDGDGAVTPEEAAAQAPDDAMKAFDYGTICAMVCAAVREALDELDLLDDEGDDDEGVMLRAAIDPVMADYRAGKGYEDEDEYPRDIYVYPAYAVACLGDGVDWQIPYTIEAGEVVLATPDAWTRVEKSYKPIPGARTAAEVASQGEHLMGEAIKLLGDDTVQGYAVRFGSPDEPDVSSYRDFFTPQTDFWLGAWDRRPMLYHHALDAGTKAAPVVGAWTEAGIDDVGVWLRGQLDKAHRYHGAIKELVRRGLLRLSSDSAPHLVVREPSGDAHKVVRWPLMAASLTVSPAEPRLDPVALKTLLADLGLDIPSPEAQASPDVERPDGAKDDGDMAARRLLLELDLLVLEDAI